MPANLQRIVVYPIKSLDGVEVNEVSVLSTGALANDRRYALVDAGGRFVNGKRTAAVQRIRAEFDLTLKAVRLRSADEHKWHEFSLEAERVELGNWISERLGLDCDFVENAAGGFPDDTDAPGPTLVSTATLREVANWFPDLTLPEVRRRFRANLEIDGVEPFWEDRLVGPHGFETPFCIGDTGWLGVNACQRCVVPTRASETGEETTLFPKTFSLRRAALLPSWAAQERFDHFYRLAVNTRFVPGQPAGVLRVGDVVRLV